MACGDGIIGVYAEDEHFFPCFKQYISTLIDPDPAYIYELMPDFICIILHMDFRNKIRFNKYFVEIYHASVIHIIDLKYHISVEFSQTYKIYISVYAMRISRHQGPHHRFALYSAATVALMPYSALKSFFNTLSAYVSVAEQHGIQTDLPEIVNSLKYRYCTVPACIKYSRTY